MNLDWLSLEYVCLYGLTLPRRRGWGRHREVRQVRQVLLQQVQLTDVPWLGKLCEPGLDVGDLLHTQIAVLLPRLPLPRPGWTGSASWGRSWCCCLPAPLGLRANFLAEQPQLGNLNGQRPAQDPQAHFLPLPHCGVGWDSLCWAGASLAS